LVQLICHGLVTRFNRQRFEEGVERERRFSLDDVEAVINAPEFFRDGNAYFTGVWVQAEKSEPAGQTQMLRTLAESETGKSAEELARQAGLTLEEVHAALETLARHDVVKKENDRWQFTVELMRRWVVQKAA
jgi:predicted Rossmann fold nucleotide-binding protein DprA/Smf involved in DNA uptake